MLRMMATALALALTAVSVQGAAGFVPPTQNTQATSLADQWQVPVSAYALRGVVLAQAGGPAAAQGAYSKADGYTAGQLAAESRGTAGSLGGGFVCGFVVPVIGPGVLWTVTRGDEVPAYLAGSYEGKGSDYSNGFADGYGDRTKQKKRGARLGGGLLGSAAGLATYLLVIR